MEKAKTPKLKETKPPIVKAAPALVSPSTKNGGPKIVDRAIEDDVKENGKSELTKSKGSEKNGKEIPIPTGKKLTALKVPADYASPPLEIFENPRVNQPVPRRN